jgi:hypothetical protein
MTDESRRDEAVAEGAPPTLMPEPRSTSRWKVLQHVIWALLLVAVPAAMLVVAEAFPAPRARILFQMGAPPAWQQIAIRRLFCIHVAVLLLLAVWGGFLWRRNSWALYLLLPFSLFFGCLALIWGDRW